MVLVDISVILWIHADNCELFKVRDKMSSNPPRSIRSEKNADPSSFFETNVMA